MVRSRPVPSVVLTYTLLEVVQKPWGWCGRAEVDSRSRRGLAIAAACDLRIATPGSRFGVPIARTLGNCLSIANYARLIAGLGASRAKRMLLLAENLSVRPIDITRNLEVFEGTTV